MKTIILILALVNVFYVPTNCQDVTIKYVASAPLSGLYVAVQNTSSNPIILDYIGTDWYLDDTGVGYKICLDSTINSCLAGKPDSSVELDDNPENWTVWTWRNENSTNIIPIGWEGNYQSNITAPYLDIDSDTIVIKNDGNYPYAWEIMSITDPK